MYSQGVACAYLQKSVCLWLSSASHLNCSPTSFDTCDFCDPTSARLIVHVSPARCQKATKKCGLIQFETASVNVGSVSFAISRQRKKRRQLKRSTMKCIDIKVQFRVRVMNNAWAQYPLKSDRLSNWQFAKFKRPGVSVNNKTTVSKKRARFWIATPFFSSEKQGR